MEETIAERVERVRERTVAACLRVGRDPADVRLIGATKGVDAARIKEALEAGVTHFGENYVQEALPKIAAVGPGATWHFIGHLQTNKVKQVVGRFAVIHSVDRPALLEELERRAGAAGAQVDGLIEVNLAGEATKSGATSELAAEILRISPAIRSVRVVGLMTMPPPSEYAEASRRYFKELRNLRDELKRRFPEAHLQHLSMGMSQDFMVAVEEGATMVRIGTALFGPRNEEVHAKPQSLGR